ncbi:MAG: glycosyltransferase family 2 protein [Sandaracinaceae bacterium]|nr:glycosyltransferase family 2 protein [Sandaracinaceae bacterium]
MRSLSRPSPLTTRVSARTLRVGARLAVATLAALGVLELLAAWLTPHVELGLHAALALAAWELAVQGLVTHAATRRRRDEVPAARASVSVLVAAWNEERDIVATVRSILAQEGVTLEVLVADDGSTDRTREALRDAFALEARDEALVTPSERLRVLTLPHRGKGAALEAARRVARHPILVTVDADTTLGPGAIERLTRPFVDPQVEAAAGSVVVRDARDVLSRFQHLEYLKTTLLRHGWSELGMLEQVPGAFAALRASAVEHAGGFPTDSLTEDYEVMFRLYARAAEEGRSIRVPTIVDACAYTEPPRTLAGLARQRTRWFAGFLVTLGRFRALTLDVRADAFGLVRLPIKWIDAIVPPWSLISLVIVLALAASAPSGASLEVSALGLVLIALRLAMDALQTHLAIGAHRGAASRLPEREPSHASTWLVALGESWSYAWLRQLLVLRAYPFAVRKARAWETSRGA